MFTLNYPFSSLPGEILISCNHGNWFSCEHPHLFKESKREKKILSQMGTVYVNFRCQNKMSLILDSQTYDAGNTYWITGLHLLSHDPGE